MYAIVLFFTHAVVFAAQDRPKVSLQKLDQTVLEKSLFYPVLVKSQIDSQIKADGQYIVLERLVELGQTVKKGTPLMVLRNQDMSVHYEQRILKSPVAGVIASISVNKGKYISTGDNIIHINNPNKLIGNIEVSAADLKKLKRGLIGKLNVTSLNLKEIPVKIKGIGAVVDGLTGTIAVELEIQDKINQLIPGVIGLAEITLNKERVTLVKEKSLYYIGEEVFIATLIENKVKKVKVELGQRHKDKIEIVSGLDVGKSFISDSPKFLRDNEEVEVLEPKKK
ncbi:MAG: multidrug efflux pump subunit AcrA (membrane-fusion protein) [Bacteriovoracaceae bacterium]|jgi:multidrug efflux pump subunit AcrA (membrane-fusion protein)